GAFQSTRGHYPPTAGQAPGPAPTLHFDSVPPFVTVPIASATSATPRSVLLTLDLHDAPLTFKAGQAVVIGDHRQPLRKPYSIASSPEQSSAGQSIELLVGLDALGSSGPHLPSLAPGTSIDVEGPLGAFTFPDTLRLQRLLFVGGGTGIAPLRAMMDHAMRVHPPMPMALLYSARRADEFAF